MSPSRRGLFRAAARAAARAVVPDDDEPAIEAALTGPELERYSRQLLLDGWGETQQLRLRDASALVVGAGALGSPVAAYLAGAGVGRLGIVDGDAVELSNLHRQHLHLTSDVGASKAHSAVARLQLLNPECQVEPYQVRLDAANAAGLVTGQDLVVDCSDSFPTRYAVNRACCEAGVALVEGGVVGLSGLVMSVLPGQSACYRCTFPREPARTRSCAEAGILGPAAGVVGSLQAMEALRLLGGLDGALLDAFLQVDLAEGTFLRVATRRRDDCPDCGDH